MKSTTTPPTSMVTILASSGSFRITWDGTLPHANNGHVLLPSINGLTVNAETAMALRFVPIERPASIEFRYE